MFHIRNGKIICLILCSILLLSIAGLLVFWMSTRQNVKEVVPTPIPTSEHITIDSNSNFSFINEKTIISTETIQDELCDMGVLITGEYMFTDILSSSSSKKLFGSLSLPGTKSSYVVSYDGVVSAGTDLSDAKVEKDDTLNTITVYIPKASIRSTDIDPESFVLIDESQSIFNPMTVDDFNDSLIELENSARSKALEKGILDRADSNAVRIIRDFVESIAPLYIVNVEVY